MTTDKPTCKTCDYFECGPVKVLDVIYGGTCRIKSIAPVELQSDVAIWNMLFPPRDEDMWCGEHPQFNKDESK